MPKSLHASPVLSSSAISPVVDEIVRRILSIIHPEKIILFGSYAKGNQTQDSDIDILIIMNSTLPRHKRSIPLYRALMDIHIPQDILVYTPKEVAEWAEVSSSFITSSLQSGIVLYDKNSP
ncbi:MAG: nucleotidyltransferase domain-containing protein [Methanospirillum sp.]|uniref:nucleotidyltransferase domain-containing protein n=1 Tax=Methanospirillum sp. TaxID=45200 RepID=UPI0023732524|nr:nucleotidyltransferase domain-containing protein [Methanospirillum sp.]MDD1729413.1 nucleotidyltransferase domain-containing protein [Methanospirillum sp.]